jgi:hypothetical protein
VTTKSGSARPTIALAENCGAVNTGVASATPTPSKCNSPCAAAIAAPASSARITA